MMPNRMAKQQHHVKEGRSVAKQRRSRRTTEVEVAVRLTCRAIGNAWEGRQ